MNPRSCRYCGAPLRGRRARAGGAPYCGSGCALADRLPRADENGQFPATPALIAAAVTGFVLFNEALFWTLSLAGRAGVTEVFGWISGSLGFLVWGALTAALRRAAVHTASDAFVAITALAVVIWAVLPSGPGPGGALAANAAFALWVARGWGKKKFLRKPALPV